MSFQQQAILVVFSAQVHQDTALDSQVRVIAQGGKLVVHPLGGLGGKARGTVDGQQLGSVVPAEIRVFLFHFCQPPKRT